MEISKELAQDILAYLKCEETLCEACYLHNKDCDARMATAKEVLRDALEGVEQKESVSQETFINNTFMRAEPEQATKYITIPVAEYHFLTKAATLLEIVLADKSYSPNTVLAAVRTVVQEMVQRAEAGAAE